MRDAALLRLRRRNIFEVELLCDRFQGKPFSVEVENPSDNDRLGFVNFEPHAVRIFAAAIAEASAARVQSATNEPFKSATNALRRVREEKLVNHPTRQQKKLEFLIAAVDSLGDKVNFDAGETQALAEVQNIGLFAGKSARVLEKHNVKRSWL